MGVQLIIMAVCGAIAAAIASHKGRNVVGWFFGGFFLQVIGIIIVACLGNLKEQRAYRQHTENERRRLREQLRQERLKTEAFRQYSLERLDSHDEVLGVDTRKRQEALPGPAGDNPLDVLASQQQQQTASPPPEPGAGERALRPLAEDARDRASQPVRPRAAMPPEAKWFYEVSGQAKGPVSKDEVQMFLRSGILQGSTLLWTEGLADWTAAGDIDAFRSEVDS